MAFKTEPLPFARQCSWRGVWPQQTLIWVSITTWVCIFALHLYLNFNSLISVVDRKSWWNELEFRLSFYPTSKTIRKNCQIWDNLVCFCTVFCALSTLLNFFGVCFSSLYWLNQELMFQGWVPNLSELLKMWSSSSQSSWCWMMRCLRFHMNLTKLWVLAEELIWQLLLSELKRILWSQIHDFLTTQL